MIVHEKYKKLQNNKIGQGRHNFIFVLNEKLRCFFSGSFTVLNKNIYYTICEKTGFVCLCVCF